MSDGPVIPFWLLWTDGEGVSRFRRSEITDFHLASMKPPAAPQWQGEVMRSVSGAMVTVQPVGWVGEWHENPKPQWIVPLSGRWFVEAMDGTRIEMGPGELSFGGDQGCVEKDGRIGHRSGTLGDAPAVLMVVQFEPGRAPDFR